MRISMSMVFAVLISFLLLGIMATLVQQQELPPLTPPTRVENFALEPPVQQPDKPIRTPLPEQQKTIAQPDRPEILIEASEPNEAGPTLPPTITPVIGIPGLPTASWQPDYRIGEHDRNGTAGGLVPISQLQPQYPRAEAANGIEGWVSVRFEVRQDGSVGNVQVLNGSPRGVFDHAAIKAVQRWRYRPTEQGPVVQTVTLDFKLEQ